MARKHQGRRPSKRNPPKFIPTTPGHSTYTLAQGIGGLVGPVPIDQILRREATHLQDVAHLVNMAAEDLLYVARRFDMPRLNGHLILPRRKVTP